MERRLSGRFSRTAAPSGVVGAVTPEARQLWHGIVEGRLAVARQYDEAGRRYLVVQPVDTSKTHAERLTPRERKVVGFRAHGYALKRISLELGVSVPTVSRALTAALNKLGLSSDLELAAIFGGGLYTNCDA